MESMNKKLITMTQYQKEMDKIIAKGLSIEDTLILMLQEASKYEIEELK
jgi:hypothetical protein